MEPKPDLAIVSMHEKGFPQGDLYEGCGEMGSMEFEALGKSPDDFFTMVRGSTIEDARAYAQRRWLTARVVDAAEDNDEMDDE